MIVPGVFCSLRLGGLTVVIAIISIRSGGGVGADRTVVLYQAGHWSAG